MKASTRTGSQGVAAPVALVNARLVDPARGSQTRGGLLIVDGLIAQVGGDVTAALPAGGQVVDCGGDVVCHSSPTAPQGLSLARSPRTKDHVR